MQDTEVTAPKSMSLDAFNAPRTETPEIRKPEAAGKPKAKRTRRTKDAIKQEQINALIEQEHALDGKSKTVNIERCFLSELRVSNEVWEEIRARTIESLQQSAHDAEARAKKEGRKTIQIQDVV